MLHFELDAFLSASVGLLGLMSLCLLVFGRLGIGSIVAFLVSGIVIEQLRHVPVEAVTALREFAELGIILLLFLIGLEVEPSELRRLGRYAAILGVPQIVASALPIGLYLRWFTGHWEIAVVLALSFALSSTVVVVQLLRDRGQLHTSWGSKAFAILLAQDLAIVPFLFVVSLLADRGAEDTGQVSWAWAVGRALVVVVGIVLVGRFVLPRILTAAEKQGNQPAFTCVVLFGVLAAALVAEKAGLSMALGTFLLGATLAVSPLGHRIAATIEPYKSTLLALFFLSVGLSVDLTLVRAAWALILINTIVILSIKGLVILALALIARVPIADGVRLALALTQCGEFGFVLFGAAQSGGLISAQLSALASVLIILSMILTPLMVWAGERLVSRAPRLAEAAPRDP